MPFEWDEAKDRSNQRKHGLSFAEAQRLFESDADYLELFDAEHSELEDRFIAIGPIDRGLVVIVYTERDEDVLRILSARPATKNERRLFEAYGRSGHEPRRS